MHRLWSFATMIQLFRVSKYYEGVPAVREVSFTIDKGEFVFVTGSSGAGKTTLLKILFCAERADEGQIIIQGMNVFRIDPSGIPYLRRNMGFVFQDYKLLPHKTVLENIGLALKVVGTPYGEIEPRAYQALKKVGMENKRHLTPPKLSGGEQQRVAAVLLAGATGPAGATSFVIGDNDGYGIGICDGCNHPFNGSTANYDGRSAAEQAATDGAQYTDTYSTTHPRFGPQPGTVATFVFSGLLAGHPLWTIGHLEIDAADFQASTFGAVITKFNGIVQPFDYNDVFPRTVIHHFDLRRPSST